jgi:chromosome partitioning protein
MGRTLSISNNKGGVGKTHTVFHLAGALAESGHRVLVVDLDPQGSLSGLFLDEIPGPTLYDALLEQLPLTQAIRKTSFPLIDIAPADQRLETLSAALQNEPDQQIRLDTALRERQGEPEPYDVVLLDCPPNIGVNTRNALAAADGVLVPLEADKFSVDGLQRLLELIGKMQRVNARLVVAGILISLYNGRRTIEQAYEEALRNYPGIHVLDVKISDSAKYREAITARRPITHYKPVGEHAEAFRELARIVFPPVAAPTAQPKVGAHAYAKHD